MSFFLSKVDFYYGPTPTFSIKLVTTHKIFLLLFFPSFKVFMLYTPTLYITFLCLL